MKNNFVSFENVDFLDGFWKERYLLNKNVSLANVRKRFEDSGRFDALRFNFIKNGKKPHIFFDSDVAKWIEATAYLIAKDRKSMKSHEALCDELIDAMGEAQREDGYLNSTHQQINPELIFKRRGRHELYCAGHLIEAAIAYHKATGKDKFLKIMEKNCECINNAFIVNKTAEFVTPGHEEIELALFKLYNHTKKTLYKDMAAFFLKMRGVAEEPLVYDDNPYATQDDVDIYNLKEANGHSVRALYLYSGIADLALEENDQTLVNNLKSVFYDITDKKMYITGGVGSTYRSESFNVPYDLPNMTAYSESCCAIAMILFAARMRRFEKNADFGHLVERVMYNSLLSSTSIDGKSFFYENPLEIALEEYDREIAVPKSKRERLPIKERVEVFECSCCPPNINRFFGEFGSFIVFEDKTHATVEQYVSSIVKTKYGVIRIEENYAKDGQVRISSKDYSAKKISVRIPEWCDSFTFDNKSVNTSDKNGYYDIKVSGKFDILIDFNIKARFLSCNPLVSANVGRVALTYGPIVYCLEGVENGERLNQVCIDTNLLADATLENDFHGFYSIKMKAFRSSENKKLYFDSCKSMENEFTAKFIPYYAFANRGESDMLVWVRKKNV